MIINHKKYPIIIGASYINKDGEVGILEAAEIFPRTDEAEIIINMQNRGRFYKLNYSTFAFNWKLLEKY